MNKYGCSRFCNHYKSVSPHTDCGGWVICEKSGCEIDMNRMILLQEVGCVSHSSVMNEKNKVLDIFLKEMRGEMTAPFEYLDWDSIESVYIRLRSKRDDKS